MFIIFFTWLQRLEHHAVAHVAAEDEARLAAVVVRALALLPIDVGDADVHFVALLVHAGRGEVYVQVVIDISRLQLFYRAVGEPVAEADDVERDAVQELVVLLLAHIYEYHYADKEYQRCDLKAQRQ